MKNFQAESPSMSSRSLMITCLCYAMFLQLVNNDVDAHNSFPLSFQQHSIKYQKLLPFEGFFHSSHTRRNSLLVARLPRFKGKRYVTIFLVKEFMSLLWVFAKIAAKTYNKIYTVLKDKVGFHQKHFAHQRIEDMRTKKRYLIR